MGLWQQRGVQDAALLALGVVGAAVWRAQPLALALIVPPLMLVHRSNEQVTAIRATNQRLEAELQAQRRFVADASHELRSPLTAMQGNIDLVRAGALRGAGAQEALTDIAREIDRLARLVADLLTLAQADEGQALSLAPIDLEALSYDVYRQVRPLARQVAMDFALEESRDDGVVTLVDPDRYRQLLGNLLDNALKYTPPGGQVQVRVTAEEGWAKVEVADTGAGIPPEEQDRIFERFYRVNTDRARSKGGAGLGLAIAKWVADAHGGRITVASEPGRGTTFTVWLPLRAA
jgi:signal transduction histidine kinase